MHNWVAGTESVPVARFLIAVGLVLATVHVCGSLATLVRQPRVVGAMLAGIALGPSLLGRASPSLWAGLFPPLVLEGLEMAAQLGLVVFVFLLGCQVHRDRPQGTARKSGAIAFAGSVPSFLCALPFAALLHPEHAGGASLQAFSAFLGLALAVTALPVLGRVLEEEGLLASHLGRVALGAAVAGDAIVWIVLAFVLAIGLQTEGQPWLTLPSAGGIGFAFLASRRMLEAFVWRLSKGPTPEQALLTFVLVGSFLSAAVTQAIGLHALFGAFLFGSVMPTDSTAVNSVMTQVQVGLVGALLPLFFACVGLRTSLDLLGPSLSNWFLLLALITSTSAAKALGAGTMARLTGLPRSEAMALGVLMNCRGVTELVVASIGLQAGLIDEYVFTILVVVAVVTTALTTPLLRHVLKASRQPA